ncbi:MAG: TIR domain-containing protein [Terricaulis sp.]
MAGDALRVFISYARRDASAFAEELLCGLEVAGFEAFLDRHDIEAGVDWEARLGGLIESADTVVFVISPAAVGSERCGWEVRRAEQLSKRVIPVVLVDVPEEQTPHGLKRLNYIFFTEGNSYSAKLGELAKALRVDFNWIREHTRLGEMARRWQARDKNAVLLLRGGELDAARAWLAAWKAPAPEPTDLHRAFINDSETAENAALKDERERLKKQARVQLIAWYATGAALAVTLIGAALVINSRRDLNVQTSLVLAGLGYNQYESGDTARGLRFSLLAAKGGSIFSPVADEALDALAANASGVHPLAEMRGHEEAIVNTVVSKDGHILTRSEDGTARFWDADGAAIAVLRHPGEAKIAGARFFEDGRVLTWDEKGLARLWSAAGAAPKDLRHGEGVLRISLSEDQSRILTRGEDNSVRLWDAVTAASVAALDGTYTGATFVAGGRVLTSASDNTLRVWDGANGALVRSAEGAGVSIGVSPEGGAAVVSTRERIGVVNLATGALTDLTFPDAQVARQVATRLPRALFQEDGSRFLLRWFGGAGIWDAATGRPVKILEIRSYSTFLSEDRRRILVRSEQWRVLDTNTGEQVGVDLKDIGDVVSATFYADNNRLLLSGNGRLRLVDVETGQVLLGPIEHEGLVRPLLLAEDSRILTWSQAGEMRVWDAESGVQIGPTLQHGVALAGVALTEDKQRVVTWSEDGVARLWSTEISAQIGATIQHEDNAQVGGAFFLANDTRILSWSAYGARLSNAETGAQIALMRHGDDTQMSGALVARDQILSWGSDGAARFWNAQTGEPAGAVLQHEAGVTGASLTADGRRVLTWSADGRAQLWNAATRTRIGSPMLHEEIIGALLSPQESRVVTWSAGGTGRIWNAANGARVGAEMRHEGAILGAMFEADGSRVLTWSEDNSARLWDAATGRLIGVPMRHEEDGAVNGALFAADGERVLTWGDDRTLRWWNATTGVQIGEALEHDNPVQGALFSADSGLILSWTGDEAKQWDARTGAEVAAAIPHDSIAGARYSAADESRILTWGSDGFARIWNANTGVEVGPAMRLRGLNEFVYGAVFSRDENRVLTWGDEGAVRLWDVRWTRRRPDIAALRREVCAAIPASVRRIDVRDIEIAPILRGRENSDVCR